MINFLPFVVALLLMTVGGWLVGAWEQDFSSAVVGQMLVVSAGLVLWHAIK